MSRIGAHFTENNVFANPAVNNVCDRVVRVLDKYVDNGVTSDFAFYGVASQIYQGDPPVEVGVVQFITGRSRIYRAALEKIPREIKDAKIIAYADRAVCEINGVFIEIIKSANVIVTVDVNNIKCYDYTAGAQDNLIKDTDPQPGQDGYTNPIVPNDNYT